MRVEKVRREIPKVVLDKKLKKKNYTTIFLLPALGISKDMWDKYGFVNAFIGDDEHEPKYAAAIYVLLEPKFDAGLEKFIDLQSKRDIFLEEYDIGGGQVVIVYRFPPEYGIEYCHFLAGEYSKFSKKYVKEYFPMTKREVKDGKSKVVSTVFAGIFNKEEWLKKYWQEKLDISILPDEYWSIPDGREVLRKKSENE